MLDDSAGGGGRGIGEISNKRYGKIIERLTKLRKKLQGSIPSRYRRIFSHAARAIGGPVAAKVIEGKD
jgi:hypothetical protein